MVNSLLFHQDARIVDGRKVYLADTTDLRFSQAPRQGNERELRVLRKEDGDPRLALQACDLPAAPYELRYIVPNAAAKLSLPVEADVEYLFRNADTLREHAGTIRPSRGDPRSISIRKVRERIEDDRDKLIARGAVCRVHSPILEPTEILAEPGHVSRPGVVLGATSGEVTVWLSSTSPRAIVVETLKHGDVELTLGRAAQIVLPRKSFVRYYCRELLGRLDANNLSKLETAERRAVEEGLDA